MPLVYYKTCPEVTAAFAKYPETPTGKTEAAIDKRDGVCVANAIPSDEKPFSFCKSDGTWLYSQGGCQCTVGRHMGVRVKIPFFSKSAVVWLKVL